MIRPIPDERPAVQPRTEVAGPGPSLPREPCPRRALPGLLALCLGVLAPAASAQTVRTDFFITNGQVTTQVLRGNTLYVGGSFSFVGPVTGSGVPVDTATAVPVPDFPRINGSVNAVVPDGSGGWYIGGQFTSVGASARANLAHVQADLSVSGWNPGAGGIVRALVLRSGIVYAAGDFTTLGGIARNRIGAVHGVTGAATSWNPNANASVRTIVDGGSALYAGGQFTTIGAQVRNRIARLDYTSGAADPAWNPNSNGVVMAMHLESGPGLLYVAGQFTAVGGQSRNRVAAVAVAGGTASAWNPNANNQVFSIVVSGGTAYVGGQFTTVGGQARNRIAALDTGTGLATAWNPNASNTVQAIALGGPVLYAGGDFLTIGGQSRSRVAAIDLATGLATAWNPTAFNTVATLYKNDGVVFVGGTFNGIGGTPRDNLAAFDVTTGEVTAWNPDANDQVQALALTSDHLLAGGNFTLVGGVVRNGIAALDLTNGQPTSWDPNCDGQVSALAVTGNRVYAGGLFTTIGGAPRANLAALHAGTGAAEAWVANTDEQVFAIEASTPTIYVGGSFLNVNASERNFIAAVDAATGAVTAWNPDANGTVRALALNCDRIFVGGFFTSIGGAARNRLALLHPVSGAALAWDPNANGPVFALVPTPGTIYLGGVLSTVGGVTRNRIAAVDPQTGALSSWNPNSNGTVRSILADATQVYVGGMFTTMNAAPSGNLAVMTPDPSALCPVIALPAPPLAPGVQGSGYSVSLAATGGVAPYCYAVSAGALPAGLTLDPATGQLAGTPAAAGLSVFSITATDQRGCTGIGSYTLTITAAPAVNSVAANGAGLCLNPAQACVAVPFSLTRGDAVGLRGVSVTFQLETAKLQLCNPGVPSNFHLGSWASGFAGRTLQVHEVGPGRYTVDIVILGSPCGETGGGTLFTVDVAAVGPTGSGSLTVTNVIARDCANAPVATSPGPVGQVAISGSAITLSPATLPNALTGTSYEQTITATGASGPVTFTVSAGAPPPGLTLSPAGILSGTPTQTGVFPFTVRASEANGCAGSRAYSITVNCATITLQPAFLPDGAVGNAYAAAFGAAGGVAPLTFTLESGALPAGLTLSPGGALNGTPTTAGTSVFSVRVTDAAGCTTVRGYTLDVFATPPVSSVAAETQGLAISSAHPCVSVPVLYTRGEDAAVRGLTVSFQIDPARLALCSLPDSSVHVGSFFNGFGNSHIEITDDGGGAYTVDVTLMGSPCGITTGGTVFTLDLASAGPDGMAAITVTRVRVRDCANVAVPVLAGAPDSLRVHNAPITLAPANLPNGVIATPYSQLITAESGVAPFTFSVTAGTPPPGLALAPDGTLSGTPTATGGFAFTVSVADVDDVPGSRAYTMSVTCPVITLTPPTLPDAQVGVGYSETFSAEGGLAPYAFTVASGALPAGLTLAPTGELTGTPLAPGAAVVTIRATDASGCTGDQAYTLAVFVDPAVSRVLAITAGKCLSGVHTCVTIPFVYQKGDSAEAMGSHVTFQLDPLFALCTPGNPALSIQPGDWLAGFSNKTFQILDHGSGRYTVDQTLLGEPCGTDSGGVLFTVNVAAVGGDGVGDITLTDVRIRDCDNQPLPGQPGAPAQLVVSHSPPPAISDLASVQVTSGNGAGQVTGITVAWSMPASGTVALYRAPFGTYPEFDDGGGAAPDSNAAPGATWTLVSSNAASGLVDVPPARGSWHYVAFLTDSCGNVSAVSNLSRGSLDYHLGDVSNGAVRGTGDNRVGIEDISLLGAHYGISGATLVTDSVAYLDVGPTVNGLATGRPVTDNSVDFEDLMLFSTNFQVVSSPAIAVRPQKPNAAGSGEGFDLEAPVLVVQGDEIEATLRLAASGTMQGFSVQLAWDAGALQALDASGAGLLEGQGGVVFSPRKGTVDAALLGRRGIGITGSGPAARFRFRVLRDGDPALKIAKVIARDAGNRPLDPERFTRSLTAALPTHTVMLAPAPNPAVGEATLAFALAEAGDAELHVYAVDGRRVRTLARGRRDPGVYRLTWRGEDDSGRPMAPGVYWARLTTPGRTFSRRIVFLR